MRCWRTCRRGDGAVANRAAQRRERERASVAIEVQAAFDDGHPRGQECGLRFGFRHGGRLAEQTLGSG